MTKKEADFESSHGSYLFSIDIMFCINIIYSAITFLTVTIPHDTKIQKRLLLPEFLIIVAFPI